MPPLDIHQLKVFLTAAEENNFSAAARRLHMSQSAVSQHIRALEQVCQVELFIRHGRNVRLSEAGENLLPMAREALHAFRLLEDNISNVVQTVGGKLLIGCSTSAGRYLLPTLLSLFQQQHPNVRSHVQIASREHLVEMLLNESIPIGVVSCQIEHRELAYMPLFEDRIILVVPPDHPWASFGKALPTDLLDQRLILREESSGTRATVLEGLKAHGITEDNLNIAMVLGSAEAIEMAVECGTGVAFLSEMVAARGLAVGRLARVEVEGLALRRWIYMARRVDRPLTRTQALFWQYAQEMRAKINSEIWNSLTAFNRVC